MQVTRNDITAALQCACSFGIQGVPVDNASIVVSVDNLSLEVDVLAQRRAEVQGP